MIDIRIYLYSVAMAASIKTGGNDDNVVIHIASTVINVTQMSKAEGVALNRCRERFSEDEGYYDHRVATFGFYVDNIPVVMDVCDVSSRIDYESRTFGKSILPT